MKLVLSVGTRDHYRIGDIHGHRFTQTGEAAGLSAPLIGKAIDETRAAAESAFSSVEADLPSGFP